MDFDYIVIDKCCKTPLYEQIKQSISDAIKSGILHGGDKLPTEEQMSERFGVSRVVTKQAYTDLLNEGKIVRMRSKGTFVKEQDNRGEYMEYLLSYEEEMLRLGKKPVTRLLCQKVVHQKELWKLFPEPLFQTEGEYLYLKRVRFDDDTPFNITVNIVPLARTEGLSNKDFGKESLYQVLKTEYKIVPDHGVRSLSAVNASKTDAQYLKVPENRALMLCKSIVYDSQDNLIEVSYEYMDGQAHPFQFAVRQL